MDNSLINFKDLYSCYLKATYPMEINGTLFEPGETVAKFDRILISNFGLEKDTITAHGGYEDRDLVFWETLNETPVSFTQGSFNKEQFSLLTNSHMYKKEQQEPYPITTTVVRESDMYGYIYLDNEPIDVFVYSKEYGYRLMPAIYGKRIYVAERFREFIVTYTYNCETNCEIMSIGKNFFNGYLTFEGRTRIKDDTTGQITTGIITIPKFKLMSDLSMRLGTNGSPMVANFSGVAVPVGARGSQYVMKLAFLDSDLDSDF